MYDIEFDLCKARVINIDGIEVNYIKRDFIENENTSLSHTINSDVKFISDYMKSDVVWFDGVVIFNFNAMVFTYGVYKDGRKYLCSLLNDEYDESSYILFFECINEVGECLIDLIKAILSNSI